MPHKPKPTKTPDRAFAITTRKQRLLIAFCLIVPPLLLLAHGLFTQALLPADQLAFMAPWQKIIPSNQLVQWNALIWDAMGQYYPWRSFAARSFHAGYLPLWNPYQFCGTPFLANGQSALLYPLNLLFWIFDPRRAFGWSALVHLILAGWFSYLFLRSLRLRRLAALVGAEVFALNGYFITWLYLPTLVNSAVWLPLALLFCEKYFRTVRVYFAALLGAAVAMMALAGHPQAFLMCGFLVAVYFIARAISQRAWSKLIAGALLAGTSMLLLAGAQLLPLLEFMGYSHRGGGGAAGYQFYLAWSLPWQSLVTLFSPDFYGNPQSSTYWGKGNYAEMCVYAGLLPLGLAVLAAIYAKGFSARFFAIMAAIWLLCAFGTPVNWPLYHYVPGFGRFGSPARLLLLYLSCIAFLAGIGMDWLIKAYAARGAQWLKPRLLLTIMGLSIVPCVLAILFGSGFGPTQMGMTDAFSDSLPNFIWIGITGVAGIIMILVLGRVGARGRSIMAALLVVLVVVDLLIFGFHYIRFRPLREVYPATDVTDQLALDTGDNRYRHTITGSELFNSGSRFLALSPKSANPGAMSLSHVWPASDLPVVAPPEEVYIYRASKFPQAVLPPNAAMVFGARDVLGYDSLYLADYRALIGDLEGHDPSPPANGNLLLADNMQIDLLKKMGVRYLVSKTELQGNYLCCKYEYVTKAHIYELEDAPGRTWLQTDASGLREVFPTRGVGGASEMNLRDEGPDEVVISGSLNGIEKTYLVLADTYYPGWHAYVGDKELPIERANKVFRKVVLPENVSGVSFRYEPTSFKVGFFGLLLALAIASGWACGIKFAQQKRVL
jgi:hypothetical protein